MGIDQGGFSPHVLHKIVYAGVHNTSFAAGSRDLQVLAGLKIPEKQVERRTKSIGQERVDQRERAVEAAKKRFARLERIPDWHIRASMIEVEIIEPELNTLIDKNTLVPTPQNQPIRLVAPRLEGSKPDFKRQRRCRERMPSHR